MRKYPEHEKLKKISTQSQIVGEFLDWLTSEQNIVLAKWHEGTYKDELVPCYESAQNFLAQFFNIDQNKLEKEKQQMLEEFKNNATKKVGENNENYS